MSQETKVLDITNTYHVNGKDVVRKQRVSSFISKHPVGHYRIVTKEGEATVVNGQLMGKATLKSLVEEAFTKD